MATSGNARKIDPLQLPKRSCQGAHGAPGGIAGTATGGVSAPARSAFATDALRAARQRAPGNLLRRLRQGAGRRQGTPARATRRTRAPPAYRDVLRSGRLDGAVAPARPRRPARGHPPLSGIGTRQVVPATRASSPGTWATACSRISATRSRTRTTPRARSMPALEIVEALDRSEAREHRERDASLRVRIGIATGLVVVGDLIREGASEEAAAWARRRTWRHGCRRLAEPNSVVVAQATRELAGGRFEYADQGTHELKGFGSRCSVWRVLSHERGGKSLRRGPRTRRLTPFVGRAKGVGLLLGRMAARDGQEKARWCLLTGEAGHRQVAHRRDPRRAHQPTRRTSGSATNARRITPIAHCIRSSSSSSGRRFPRAATPPSRSWPSWKRYWPSLRERRANRFRCSPRSSRSPASGRYPPLQLTPAAAEAEDARRAARAAAPAVRSASPVLMLLEDAHWIDPTSTDSWTSSRSYVRDHARARHHHLARRRRVIPGPVCSTSSALHLETTRPPAVGGHGAAESCARKTLSGRMWSSRSSPRPTACRCSSKSSPGRSPLGAAHAARRPRRRCAIGDSFDASGLVDGASRPAGVGEGSCSDRRRHWARILASDLLAALSPLDAHDCATP